MSRVEPEIIRADTDELLRELARVDHVAFSLPPDDAEFERRLPITREVESYLASLDGEYVGSCGVIPFATTLPGTPPVPVGGVTYVGVLPTHKRRGVLTAMMDRMLDDCVAAGRMAATLYASEASIYGRFGFGPATRSTHVALDTNRAALRPDVALRPGRLRVLHPEQRAAVLPVIYEAALARRGGEVPRTAGYWSVHLAGSKDTKVEDRLCLVHESAAGGPDAYVLYRVEPKWDTTGPGHGVRVVEMVAVDDLAELALWQGLAQLDLVSEVEGWVTTDTPLLEALVDRWGLRTIGQIDSVWVRLLDIPAALAARRYAVPGRVVLDVVDERRPQHGGTFALAVDSDGAASVEPVDGPADLRLGVAELGSQWLGRSTIGVLSRIGRVQESTPGAAALAQAMFAWSPAPRTVQDF